MPWARGSSRPDGPGPGFPVIGANAMAGAADSLYPRRAHRDVVPKGMEDETMAHDELKEPLAGRLGGQRQVVAGVYGDLNEERVRELILENLRELRYPATRAEVATEAERQRVPPQLTVLIDEMPDREYVSVEDVADEAVRTD